VTEAFNEKYLTIVLQRNQLDFQYQCLHVIFLKNFTQYNERFGWKQGDHVLNDVSKVIQAKFPESLVYRFHGDDFIIMNKSHHEIELAQLEVTANLSEKNITLDGLHFHILKQEITTIEVMHDKIQEYLQGQSQAIN